MKYIRFFSLRFNPLDSVLFQRIPCCKCFRF